MDDQKKQFNSIVVPRKSINYVISAFDYQIIYIRKIINIYLNKYKCMYPSSQNKVYVYFIARVIYVIY